MNRSRTLGGLSAPAAVGLAAIALYVGVLAWAMANHGYEVWGSLIVVPLVIAANVPLLRRAGRTEPEQWFGIFLLVAFGAKVLGSFVRYWMIFGVYGFGDATGYLGYAARQSELWREGFFIWGDPYNGMFVGTHFLRLVTTAVYTVTGPSPTAAFVVFASLSFWGQYLLYRAFRISLPEFDHRRYALLIFLLPSLLFWPSSVGKEAWLMLCLGAVALGAARLYRHDLGALPLLLAGLVASAMVRPHITAIAAAAVLAGVLFRPSEGRALGGLTKLAAVAVLVVATISFADRAAEYIGVEELSVEGVTAAVEEAGDNTEQGGSEFTPVPLTSPLGIPAAFVTVLFRPFPWEANNLQALMASAESLVLLGLIALSWRRFGTAARYFRENPYLVFAAVYTVLFIWAFSRFGNFGIIARQRVLVMPFVLILAAFPPVVAPQKGGRRALRRETRGLVPHV